MDQKPIILLGEARGANEDKYQTSFVGASGVELLHLLDEAGVISLTSEDRSYISKYWNNSDPMMLEMVWRLHPEVHRTNVFNFHPHANDISTLCGPRADGIPGYPALLKSKYVRREYEPELDRLADEIIAHDPNLIVCLGNTPLWALGGVTGVSKLRGTTRLSTHTVADFKLLPTYHPAAVLRQWELRPTTLADLMKAVREAAFPEIRRPQRFIWIEPSLADIERFINDEIYSPRFSGILSVDVETAGTIITCIGLSPRPDLALVVPFHDTRRAGRSFWPDQRSEARAWGLIRPVLEDRDIHKVFQNGLYDIAFILRSVGIAVRGAREDTMLLHHALQPESLKSLGYLGSIYTDEGAWKSERKHVTTIKRDE